ncbi:MAG TPA: tetratricopeptide repeat protein [Pyrinomonadaceae bacterium]|nr:tetratricopeptide repeat protein [Pyrinomonadaceae bacterium]
MMRRSYFITSIAAVAVLLCGAAAVSAQTGQLRGHVLLKQADGTTIKAAGAQVDVFRTDLPGSFPTKTDKSGVFVYAGLPFVGRYIIAASMPNAAPNFIAGVRVGQDIDYEVVLSPGDGRRLTEAEAKALVKPGGGGSTPTGGGGAKITPEEEAKRKAENERIAKENEKNVNINKVVGEAFKAGNAALTAKNYDEALKQYDTGLAADPEQPSLLTNKTLALKARGVDRYNAAILTKDEAAKTSGLELAKADFKAAADAANKAADIIKKMPAATDPEEQKQQTVNKYATMSARAEAMRLFVTKADGTQVDAGAAAFQDYIAVETDAAKKSRAQLDMAQMLLDAGAGDKAFAEFQKILAEKPDDPDANLGAGLALFSTGDKAKYQEAANYLQRFVDKAPDTHKFKNDAKAVLAELKSTENVVPEKTNAPPRRKRP